MLLCWLLPLNEKSDVFKSDRGAQCSDSPYALFNELKKRCPQYRLIWILKDTNKVPEGAIAVKEGSIEEIKTLATSKYWIDNKRKGCWTIKRKNQIYIQTWHGPIALKKIEKDIESKLPTYYVKSAKHDSKLADLFLSNCEWGTNYIRKCFWYDGEILQYGLPRDDILFNKPTELINSVRDHYHLKQEDHIVLYAPTFRDSGNTDVYSLDYRLLLNSLTDKFGGKWKVIMRLHPNLLGQDCSFKYDDNVLNGNSIQDINGLIITSDMIITDYSSVMFDGMEAGKPVVLFATDIDTYKNDRGFNFSLDELPFPIANSNNELKQIIINYDRISAIAHMEEFMNRIEFYSETKGNASKMVVMKMLNYKR